MNSLSSSSYKDNPLIHKPTLKILFNLNCLLLILDKVHFKTKAIPRDNEGPRNPTSGYLPKETQNIKSKTCIHVFIAALFTPKHPSIDE